MPVSTNDNDDPVPQREKNEQRRRRGLRNCRGGSERPWFKMSQIESDESKDPLQKLKADFKFLPSIIEVARVVTV